ncbi:MAG: DUF934 domain-containing protein [Hyphomonadaceae bacterium]
MAREQVKRKPGAKEAVPLSLEGGVLMRDDGRVIDDDPWTFLADGEDGPEIGDFVLPLHRFLAEREALLTRKNGRLGVLIGSADQIEDIAQDIGRFALIAVAFPTFRDGRGFTTARLARERYGFAGDLRAVGDVLPDLVFYMLRCGFTSFTLRSPHPEADFAEAARVFSISYQGASDGRLPVHRLRAQKGGA